MPSPHIDYLEALPASFGCGTRLLFLPPDGQTVYPSTDGPLVFFVRTPVEAGVLERAAWANDS